MGRVRPLTGEEAAPEVQPIFDQNLKAFGQVLNSTGLYAYRPSIQLGVRALSDGITASGLIPSRLRFLINLRVASQVGCNF